MSSTRKLLDGYAEAQGVTIPVCPDLDDALIGIAESVHAGHSTDTRAVYDLAKVIDIYVKRDGMSRDEAIEFFEFNVQHAIIDGAPIFLRKL